MIGLVLTMLTVFVNGQIGITKKNSISVHPHAAIQIDAEVEDLAQSSYKGLLLPAVSTFKNLPLYNATDNNFSEDVAMEGLVMYTNDNALYNVYDGKSWSNGDKTDEALNYQKNKSRFASIGNGNEQQSVVCVLLLFCGRSVALDFGKENDGINVYNNLKIQKDIATIEYALIKKEHPNAKFTFTDDGIYEITMSVPHYIADVVSLTKTGKIQLRAYNWNGSKFVETTLMDFVYDANNFLGIGGSGTAGQSETISATFAKGDYVVARLDSPGAAVSVGSEIKALDLPFNPREIIFTKIR